MRAIVCAVIGLVAGVCVALAAEVPLNLLQNPGFESDLTPSVAHSPQPWFFFSSGGASTGGLVDRPVKSGRKSYSLQAQGLVDATQGLVQRLPVEERETYEFTVQVINRRDDKFRAGAYGLIGIEWRNAAGEEIARATSRKWTGSLSRMRWTEAKIKAKAPAKAIEGRFSIYLHDGSSAGKGGFLIDDARVNRR